MKTDLRRLPRSTGPDTLHLIDGQAQRLQLLGVACMMTASSKLAIKLISLPEEYGDLATFLGKQFTSEVVRLKHQDIITGKVVAKMNEEVIKVE